LRRGGGVKAWLVSIAEQMSFSVSYFKTLCEKYSTWAEMKAHLEGEKLRVVEEEGLAVIRYEKGQEVSEECGVWRSVVWDTAKNLPVCMAPARAKEGLPPTGVKLSSTEDFVDGFMVNAWLSGSDLRVATRTKVGGENTYYSEKTFRQLFEEAVVASPLKTMEALHAALASVLENVNGSVSSFVSFVVLHPEHRVVAKVAAPKLYVVHTGHTDEKGNLQIAERSVNWPEAFSKLQISSYPQRQFKEPEDVKAFLESTATERGWRWKGLVFKDGQGGRWRMCSTTYLKLRQLRGSEATPLERFFRLRAQRKVVDYLKHYTEERDQFWQYETEMRARTADVLAAYTDVHKAHTVKFKELSEAMRPAVFLLHSLWRDKLREKGFAVRLQNAITVVNGMRGFEKKRLMDCAPYEAVSAPRALLTEEQLNERPEEGDLCDVEADVEVEETE
jgi:hypothetical protein